MQDDNGNILIGLYSSDDIIALFKSETLERLLHSKHSDHIMRQIELDLGNDYELKQSMNEAIRRAVTEYFEIDYPNIVECCDDPDIAVHSNDLDNAQCVSCGTKIIDMQELIPPGFDIICSACNKVYCECDGRTEPKEPVCNGCNHYLVECVCQYDDVCVCGHYIADCICDNVSDYYFCAKCGSDTYDQINGPCSRCGKYECICNVIGYFNDL